MTLVSRLKELGPVLSLMFTNNLIPVLIDLHTPVAVLPAVLSPLHLELDTVLSTLILEAILENPIVFTLPRMDDVLI